MNEREFYRMVLGLEKPWEVQAVEVDAQAQKVEVRVGYEDGTLWACPESRERWPVHDHVERRWRHLDTCQFQTELVCRVPRWRWADGKVWTVPVPWAEARNRFTALFEHMAITVLLAARSLKQAAAWLRLDWSGVERIMDRAVQRGLERRTLERLVHLGLDEKSHSAPSSWPRGFLRGQSYVSVMVDLDKAEPRVLEVCEGNKKQDACELIQTLPEPVREQIQAVAMDMSAGFQAATVEVLPKADIVFDKFHVSKILGTALDQVRRREHKKLQAEGDGRLNGTRYAWLYHPDELMARSPNPARDEAFEDLCLSNLQTARAYYHRLMFLEFWESPDNASAQSFFTRWYHEAKRSCLEPIKKAAETLKTHLHGLLTYFKHRITNATTEALNSSIQAIKSAARGFRSFENYRVRILFFLGRLNLHPL